jgi:hypothetical protein
MNTEAFIRLIHEIKPQNEFCLVGFDINLFTNVPVEEVLLAIRNRLSTDPSFPQHSPLQVEDITEFCI